MATLWEKILKALGLTKEKQDDGLRAIYENELYEDLSLEDKKRLEKYEAAWRYYRGEHKPQLKTISGLSNDNVILNYSRRIVDKGVSFLFGKEVEFQIEEGRETEAERALNRIWGPENKRGAFLNELAINGAVCGTFYIQIVPSPVEGEPPRLINLNPAVVFPIYNPMDVDDVLVYELRYLVGRKIRRQVWAISENRQNWIFWTEEKQRNKWVLIPMPVMNAYGQVEMSTEPQTWPYPWAPIVAGKNLPNPNSFFGLSDLEDADVNDAINFVASNTNRILKIYAHPVVWGRNMGRDKLIDWTPGKALNLGPSGEMHALEMESDMAASRDHLKQLIKAYHEIVRVPENDPESLRLGSMSGFALRILYSDLIEKTETKRRLYGDALVRVSQYALELMGYPNQNVKIHWQDPLPVDERAEIERDRFDLEYGLASRETVMMRRGLDPAVERERIAAEQAQSGEIGAMLLREFETGRQQAEAEALTIE